MSAHHIRVIEPAPVAASVAGTFRGLMPWQAERVLAYIEARLETPLRAVELGAVARLSTSHFSRAFKVSTGRTPHAYVLARRVERAKRLMLADDPVPLAEIALRCGLSDQAHLSRVFRKIVAESPGAWRRRNGARGGADRSRAYGRATASS
jgi:AraC family transcriptional regulator